MKYISLILAVSVLAGCSTAHRKGISQVDEFDAVKVDQMVGNNISSAPFQKVIVCLNARRETRTITAITNVDIRSFTNAVVNSVTNETITMSTNFLVTTMTNLQPALPGQAVSAPATGEAAAAAAATVPAADAPLAAVTNAPPVVQGSTNVTTSLAQNNSAIAGPTQRGANAQIVRTYNNQITSQTNNLSITMMTNLVITAETNASVAFVTNYTVSSVTNVAIAPANTFEHDYYLYSEMVPPPEFVLSSGESLILLVDGVRYGLTSSQSSTAFVGRKGYNSTLYRVPAEVLVAIANANEVRVRLKGSTSVIERTMNDRSRQNFKAFLVRYFSPEGNGDSPPATAGSTATAGVSVSAPTTQANLQ